MCVRATTPDRSWRLERWALGILAILLSLVAVGVAWLYTQGGPGTRLVVLGIDGLDSRIVRKLVEQGKLPTFARLYREGATGTVRNSELGVPPVSPPIWTTYATGVVPEAHGIRGFVVKEGGGVRLYRSLDCQVPAAWEIFTQAGRSAGVVNWWFTFPPKAVRGFVISDRYFEQVVQGLQEITQAVAKDPAVDAFHPSELALRLTLPRSKPLPRVLSADDAEHLDGAVLSLAFAAWEHVPVEALFLFLNGLDRVGHMTWDKNDPAGLGGREYTSHLQTLDEFVASVLRRAGARAHVLLLSDHGMEANPDEAQPGKFYVPGVHESREAADAGVILLHGPQVLPGTDVGEVSPLDVFPTILALLGVPPPAALRGRVPDHAFRPGTVRSLPARADYHRLPPASLATGGAREDAVDQATKERLRALGYLEDTGR